MFPPLAQLDRRLGTAIHVTLIALVACKATTAAAALISVTTANIGGLQVLTSVTVDRGQPLPSTFTGNSLVDIDVNHWHSTDAGSNALSVGGTDPGVGNRATLIDGDLAVNTGMVNPGEQAALSVAQQATVGPANSTLNGLGVTFGGGGLVNNPGDDVIVFVYSQEGNPDGFIVSRVDGVLGSTAITSGDYTVTAAGLTTGIINSNETSLNAFEAGGWVVNSTAHTQPYFGVAIDLSDLGYLAGAAAAGLFFADGPGDMNVNFTLIRGLPVSVPEGSTLSMLGLSIVSLVGSRCTGRRGRRHFLSTSAHPGA